MYFDFLDHGSPLAVKLANLLVAAVLVIAVAAPVVAVAARIVA